MKIEIFTICDYSNNLSGKLIIVGTFDNINAKQFPAVHPALSLALRLRFYEDEYESHRFKIRLIDENENEVIKAIEGNMNVNEPSFGNHSSVNFSLNFAQIKFDSPGKYTFELYIDDNLESDLSLNLVKHS